MATAPGSLQSSPAQLGIQVRQRLISQAALAMNTLQSVVQERLTAAMDEAGPSREMQLRRDVWMAYQRLKGKWLEGTVKAWQAALVPTPSAAPQDSKRALSLELLGTEVVENKIISSRLALNLMEKAAQDVNDLRHRLKFLNGGQSLNPRDIVHPEVLIQYLVEEWEACGLSRESWPLITGVVQNHLNEHLQKAYAHCNQELVEQGVQPEIDFSSSVPSSISDHFGEAVASAQAAAAQSGRQPLGRRAQDAGMPAGQVGGGQGGPVVFGPAGRRGRAQNVLEQVGRMLSGAFFSGGGPGRGGGVAPGNAAQGGMYVGNAGSGQSDGGAFNGTVVLGSSWDGAASGPAAAGTAAAPRMYAGPSVPLMAALAQQPPLNPVQFVTSEGGSQVVYPGAISQVASELRQQSSDLKGKAQTDHEKAIIELVGLMFESILHEDRIPTDIRVWFARLQIPVLRIALSDPEFFNQTDHPARKLIDHMGSCVLGFDSSGIGTDAMATEIKRIVQVIEQYPETGDRVYKRVYEEFQTFLKQHLATKPAAQKVMGVAEQLEQKETLAIQYTIEFRDQLKDMPVRDEIRAFLFKVWAEVLAVSTVRQGKQHDETIALKKTATDLIWAASAKPNRTDRSKVIAGLPALLQSLRSGMTLLGMARSAQEAHIKVISDTLADAFMSKTEAIADGQIQALAKRLEELDDYVSEGNGQELPLDSSNIEELLGIETTELDVVNEGGGTASPVMLEWASELSLGSWFALTYKSTTAQVQLVWRSPLGHLHLFANSVGHSYLFQSPRLAAYLQVGALEPQEEESLMTRAARSALEEIQANPECLLN